MVVFHREILCWMIKRVCLSRKGLGYLRLHVIGRIKYIYRSIPYGEPTNPHSNPILASAGNRSSVDVQTKTLAPDSDNFYDSLIIQCPDGRDVCYSLRSEEELTLKSTHFLFAFLFESAPPSYLVGSFLLKLRKQGLTGLLLTLALQRQYCLHLSPTQGLGLSLERISCISRYENRSCILSYRNVNRDASG